MKKQQILIFGTVALIVIVIGTIVYLTKPQGLPIGAVVKKPEKEPIRIGVSKWPGWAPLYLAKEKGFFEKNDVNVELIDFGHDYTIHDTALTLKLVDAEPALPSTIQLNADKGTPLVTVMGIDYSYGGDGILATEDIKEIKDLRGKKVAFGTGTTSHYFLFYLLKKENIKVDDIITVEMLPADAAAAFASGKVDAAVTYEPWLSQAVKMREGGHILISSRETPELIPSLLTFRKDVIEKRPEDVKKIMKVWYETLDYIREQPEESNNIMAKSMGLSLEEFLEIKSTVGWFDHNKNKEFFGTKDHPGRVFNIIDTVGDIWLEAGLIKEKVNATDVVDTSYLESLYD